MQFYTYTYNLHVRYSYNNANLECDAIIPHAALDKLAALSRRSFVFVFMAVDLESCQARCKRKLSYRLRTLPYEYGGG